jgi:hypothetical protein
MSNNTIIQQGFFTSTGSTEIISLRSGVDWMRVYNTTVAAANQTTAIGVEYYWQVGFPSGAQWEYLKSNAADAANLSQYLTSGGFTYVDSSVNRYGVVNATVTAVSTATIPVVTNSGTNGLSAGNVVRLLNVAGAPQLGGMDFTVGYNTLSSTTFSLDYMATLSVAGTTGSWMQINFDPLYYPTRRYITAISQATEAVVTLSVTHGYQIGQSVRMVVPSAFGMTQMNGLQGTIVAINTTTTTGNTITLDINSSAFTAFAFPLAAAFPFTYAQVVPIGEDTAAAESAGVSILTDATVNNGFIGMELAAGANGPAGQSGNVIYWQAGKSFSNGF